jgi:hypothetical protein
MNKWARRALVVSGIAAGAAVAGILLGQFVDTGLGGTSSSNVAALSAPYSENAFPDVEPHAAPVGLDQAPNGYDCTGCDSNVAQSGNLSDGFAPYEAAMMPPYDPEPSVRIREGARRTQRSAAQPTPESDEVAPAPVSGTE